MVTIRGRTLRAVSKRAAVTNIAIQENTLCTRFYIQIKFSRIIATTWVVLHPIRLIAGKSEPNSKRYNLRLLREYQIYQRKCNFFDAKVYLMHQITIKLSATFWPQSGKSVNELNYRRANWCLPNFNHGYVDYYPLYGILMIPPTIIIILIIVSCYTHFSVPLTLVERLICMKILNFNLEFSVYN